MVSSFPLDSRIIHDSVHGRLSPAYFLVPTQMQDQINVFIGFDVYVELVTENVYHLSGRLTSVYIPFDRVVEEVCTPPTLYFFIYQYASSIDANRVWHSLPIGTPAYEAIYSGVSINVTPNDYRGQCCSPTCNIFSITPLYAEPVTTGLSFLLEGLSDISDAPSLNSLKKKTEFRCGHASIVPHIHPSCSNHHVKHAHGLPPDGHPPRRS